MVSMTTVPPNSRPNCQPEMVRMGRKAFFSPCRRITAVSASPLERAVRI